MMALTQRIDERIGGDAIGEERPLVVLAEDNDDCRHVYGLILRHFGYDVAEVSSGEEAIEATRMLQPKLVLMDIGLPGIDGWEAGALLKADPRTSGVPLVAFSARISSTTDLVGRTDAFDGFILKPVSPRTLVDRVDAYLRLLGPQRRSAAGVPEGATE